MTPHVPVGFPLDSDPQAFPDEEGAPYFVGGHRVVAEIARNEDLETLLVEDPKSGRRRVVLLGTRPRQWQGERLLIHPNLVRVYGRGVHQGKPFVTVGAMSGATLADYVSRAGWMSAEVFVPIAAQLLKVASFLRGHGMRLGRIDPAQVLLVDAKDRKHNVKLLRVGTPAPFEALDTDDVTELGRLFFTMLTGKSTESESFVDGVVAPEHERDSSLARRLEGLIPSVACMPPEVVSLVARCLDPRPEHRPATADDVMSALIDAVPPSYFRLPRIDTTPDAADFPEPPRLPVDPLPHRVVHAIGTYVIEPLAEGFGRVAAVSAIAMVAVVGMLGGAMMAARFVGGPSEAQAAVVAPPTIAAPEPEPEAVPTPPAAPEPVVSTDAKKVPKAKKKHRKKRRHKSLRAKRRSKQRALAAKRRRLAQRRRAKARAAKMRTKAK